MGSLGEKVKFDLDRVFLIFKDLVYSVKKLHTKNLLYLALKPKNIFLDKKNQSYLLGDCVINDASLRKLHLGERLER
jgi:serine/threonine protein kinase